MLQEQPRKIQLFAIPITSIVIFLNQLKMPTQRNLSTKKVYLETFEDWSSWDRPLQMKANSAQIWDLVNPDTTDQPRQRPILPTISSYYRRIPHRHTRGSLSSQTDSQTPELTNPNQPAQHRNDLTAEDKASYNQDQKDYDRDLRAYQHEQALVKEIKDWIMETVSQGLMETCEAHQDLRTWYTNLRDSVGATTTEQQNEARAKYQTILAKAPKAAKDFPHWITDWEQATHKAQKRGIGGLDNPNVWFNDLSNTIQPALKTWYSTYYGTYKDKLRLQTLAIREVAKDLREEVSRQNLLQLAAKKPESSTPTRTEGVFGPTFGNDTDPADQPDPDQDDPQQAKSSSKRSSKKRPSDQTESKPKKKKSGPKATQDKDQDNCEACGGKHKLSGCFYANPSKAPARFKGNPVIRDAVAYRLSKDRKLLDKLASLKDKDEPSESD